MSRESRSFTMSPDNDDPPLHQGGSESAFWKAKKEKRKYIKPTSDKPKRGDDVPEEEKKLLEKMDESPDQFELKN